MLFLKNDLKYHHLDNLSPKKIGDMPQFIITNGFLNGVLR
jgi:hypothetical protein